MDTGVTDIVAEGVGAGAPGGEELPELLIRPQRGWIGIDWKELVHFRELLFFLVWRDVKVRYKQTVLGVAWAVIQPVFSMLVFTVIFGKFADFQSRLPANCPYAVFLYCGLLPWMFYSVAINMGGLSLVNQQNLLTKIYFPRLFVPAAAIGGALVDMAISYGIFALLMAWYRFVPAWTVVLLPGLLLLTVVAALGIAYVLSALTVLYRDFRFVIPFMVQALMYLSPVVWPVAMVPADKAWVKWLLALNPMYGIIGAYRSAILGPVFPWDWVSLGISTVMTVVMFVFSLFYFKKTERRFADIA